ncbi:MAG: hypothetical protein ACXW1N_09000, partial [Halobacteriota archaeon]
VYDVPQGSRTSIGRSIAQLLEFQKDEKVANVLAIKDFEQGEQFLTSGSRRPGDWGLRGVGKSFTSGLQLSAQSKGHTAGHHDR